MVKPAKPASVTEQRSHVTEELQKLFRSFACVRSSLRLLGRHKGWISPENLRPDLRSEREAFLTTSKTSRLSSSRWLSQKLLFNNQEAGLRSTAYRGSLNAFRMSKSPSKTSRGAPHYFCAASFSSSSRISHRSIPDARAGYIDTAYKSLSSCATPFFLAFLVSRPCGCPRRVRIAFRTDIGQLWTCIVRAAMVSTVMSMRQE